jgi:hypothetical protein
LCLLADRSDWARQQGDLAARLLQGTETWSSRNSKS